MALISSVCLIRLSSGQAHGIDPSLFCESCLEIVKEIENVMGKTTTHESRQRAIERVLSGDLCQKHEREDMTTSCKHLFEINYDKFRTEMLNGVTKHLDIRLCYELSLACVGVKRQSQMVKGKSTFEEDDIRALLHANKDRVRTTRPLVEINHKDEL